MFEPDWEVFRRSVDSALEEFGVDGRHYLVTPERAPRPPQWTDHGRAYLTDVWLIKVLIVSPLVLFFQGFFQEAGKDAYANLKDNKARQRGTRRLKGFVRRICSAPSQVAQATGQVQLLSEKGGPAVRLLPAIPDTGLEQLAELDWSRYGEGTVLTWDWGREVWTVDAIERGAEDGRPSDRPQAPAAEPPA